MKGRPVTIKDIARELGISPSTVSRALKDHPDISEQTKKAVNELATKYNYKPNTIALGLKHSKTNTIGLIIPEVVHHFFSSVISGIEDEAFDAGYNIMMCQTNELYEREVSSIQALMSSRVEGLIVSYSKSTHDFEHFESLIEDELPIVFFDRYNPLLQADAVIVDDEEGAFKATEHLINLGCRKIAHLSGPQNLLIGKKRLVGYIKALEKYRIKYDKQYVTYCDTYDQALVSIKELFSLPDPPDAVFAVNDLTAIGAMKTLKEMGFKIPQDIPVIGFTNGLISSLTEPSLSTVDQNGYEMGKLSFQLLMDRINNQDTVIKPRVKMLKTELMIRESTIQ